MGSLFISNGQEGLPFLFIYVSLNPLAVYPCLDERHYFMFFFSISVVIFRETSVD